MEINYSKIKVKLNNKEREEDLMGLFDIFQGKSKEKSWEEENTFNGETPPCPECGEPMTKKYVFSEMYCENMSCSNFYGSKDDDYDDDESEYISVYDAALIWASNGKDEDYMFGYTESELEDAL